MPRSKRIPSFFSARHAGFTLIELLISISILLIISVSVAGDITRIKHQEELQSSARELAGALRDLQARSLAASGVKTCTGSGGETLVCEISESGCTDACGGLIPPFSTGLTVAENATSVAMFAEVEPTENDRRPAATGESLGTIAFLQANPNSQTVTVQSLATNDGAVSSATVTFERQSGTMRIDACDSPAPYTPACGGNPEPLTLEIVLQHTRLPVTRTVRLNATTGKISLE